MVLAVAVAGLMAAAGARAAVPDTALRVPGTALRFGLSLAQVERMTRTSPVPAGPAGASPGAAARQARLRFFGLEGDATLGFEDGVLVGVQVTVAQPSPHDIDYVEDDLARQGFHRRCDARDGINRTCEWTARARVRLTTSATSLEAAMEPIVELRRPAMGGGSVPAAVSPPETRRLAPGGGGAPAAAAPPEMRRPVPGGGSTPAAAALPETLAFAAPSPSDSLPAPVVLDSCVAVRPDIARQSGVFGRVVVEVSVDTGGRVQAARVVRGVPMLDGAALECARRFRFAAYVWRGRAHPFRAALPIRFTL